MKRLSAANTFVLLIGLMVLLAGLFPQLGGPDSPLPIGWLRKAGVVMIFFNQGVLLPGEALRKGVLEWRLHLLVQASTFLLFPALVGLAVAVTPEGLLPQDVVTGFLYLSFLPTTITSAVVLTSAGEGNVTGALFNCSLSSVMGVVLVPMFCVAFLGLGESEGGMQMSSLMGAIALTLLLPLAVGQLMRPKLEQAFTLRKTMVKRFNNGVILFIVWNAFCQSFLRKVWDQVSTGDLLLTLAAALALLFVVSWIVWLLTGWAGLERPSRVAGFFCGSQKTLAVGLPMSALIFGQAPVELSLVVLPLLIYHPTQLILGGMLAPRLRST